MKELLKKASLTVATACLVAGGLVSGVWAYSDEGVKSERSQLVTGSNLDCHQRGTSTVQLSGLHLWASQQNVGSSNPEGSARVKCLDCPRDLLASTSRSDKLFKWQANGPDAGPEYKSVEMGPVFVCLPDINCNHNAPGF